MTADNILTKSNLRKTKQRVEILNALIEADGPLNQAQIAELLGDKAPNKVTIYRVLESLVTAGVVHEAFVQDRTAYSEPGHNCTAEQCHPHFTCLNCKKTHCMKDVELPMAKSGNGFKITHQQVQLEGLCPQCSKG